MTEPLTYDDITRQTVVGPDGLMRPSRADEAAAFRGARAVTPDEQVLHGRVMAAIAGIAGHVTVEIDRDSAILRGDAPDMPTISRLEQRVRDVDGIARVDNALVVGQERA